MVYQTVTLILLEPKISGPHVINCQLLSSQPFVIDIWRTLITKETKTVNRLITDHSITFDSCPPVALSGPKREDMF